MNNHKGNYGVPRDINAKVKIMGLPIIDIALVVGVITLSFVVGTKVFPTEQWLQFLLFVFFMGFTTLYLLLPTNGGKKNWHMIYLFFRRRRKRFISIDRTK